MEAASQVGVKKLVFVHHDPNSTDEHLLALEQKYKDDVKGKSNLEIIMAREGSTLEA
jgi:phosphoribosyl 1,2-cyclic phosphodiesterase